MSQECHALLVRMLEPDPAKRATVSDVMSFSWIQLNLGKDVSTCNSKLISRLKESPRVTATTVTKVRRMLSGNNSNMFELTVAS